MEVNFSSINRISHGKLGHPNEHSCKMMKKKEYNCDRPAKNVSFCGSAVSKVPVWAKKFVNGQKCNWIVDKVLEKEAVVEAAIVLGLTCTLKPLATLAMPGANKDDKEVLSVKHVLSGLIGFAASRTILGPISDATNKIVKNPSKYLKGDTEYIKQLAKDGDLMERFDVMWKKGPDILMSAPKSALITALIAPTLAILFPNHKKNKDANKTEEQKKSEQTINDKLLHSEQKNNSLSFKGRQDGQISFTGRAPNKYYEALTDFMAKGIGRLAKTEPAKKIPKALMHFKKPSPRISDLASIVLTLSLLQNTAKSKKIEKERKPYLLLNTALVTLVSSTAASLTDKFTDGALESIKKAYMSEKFNFNGEQIEKGLNQLKELKKTGVVSAENIVMNDEQIKNLKRFMRGTNKLKSHTIFSIIVRFASPLLVVPLTSYILKIIENHSKNKKTVQTQQSQMAQNVPQKA